MGAEVVTAPPWWMASLTGAGLALSLIVAIGAQNAFVLRQGLRREQIGVVVAVCALLDVLLMALGVFGLGRLVAASPPLMTAMAWAGALVLLVYAALALRRAAAPGQLHAATGGRAGLTRRAAIGQTLAISLLNPHVYLDTVVLVGAVGARQPAGQQGAFLLGTSVASIGWFVALGYGARLLTPLFARPAAWRVLDIGVALTMVAVAISLLRGAAVL